MGDTSGFVKVSLLGIGAVLFVACQSPDLPPISRPDPQVTDDLGVMKAVLDQRLWPSRDRMIELGRRGVVRPQSPLTAFSLIIDSTIASCEANPLGSPQPIRGCIGSHLLEYFGRLPQASGHVTEVTFMHRNAQSLAIRGGLGDDVVYIPSATITTATDLRAFRRRYPLGTSVW
jgi:hypothetical protein